MTIDLVADIGGTNARFALVEKRRIHSEKVLLVKDFAQPHHAIRHYLEEAGCQPRRACIAVACPAHKELVQLTNSPWRFYKSKLQKRIKLEELIVINDFTALALAVPLLDKEDYIAFGSGKPVAKAPIGVLGPGTGLGMSGLIWHNGEWAPLQGEGGHISYAPQTDREWLIAQLLRQELPRISAERILTGIGLQRIYRAICQIDGKAAEPYGAGEIVSAALTRTSESCIETLDIFAAALGDIAGDLALMLGAFGGIYIGGGIVSRHYEHFIRSCLRQRFENKGRFDAYMREIPTYIIKTELSALKGAARALKIDLSGLNGDK